ncbi:uncharacterized protein PHACADRAFT_203884 [Phanerochaete carnosa HHB-10118-sp]|uniref:Uncharacterized protein n=1 Tax=Phanerochaete carnosa (strain HHB-10118-sp) TaxID=650164 RepID=K5XCL4_PHACS|nr:uncharacterized protein PHACADRAFT_203884 [Phanerochaete carnosa HHB-10118-sp]EKM60732.1 hypothetical protein PHACADRAFT_203884 [Phanerochaete carnosa HHB-10118-sp]
MTSSDSSHQPGRLSLHPHPSQIARPLPFFHPTHALFVPSETSQPGEPTNSTHWSSRASRKNRYTPKHVPLQRYQDASRPTDEKMQQHHTVMLTEKRLRHPYTMLKVHLVWDVSFWVAVAFVIGSAAWICNGHLLYTPLSPTPSPPHKNAAAWLAFVGGTSFVVGAYLMYVESLPANTGHAELYDEFHEHLARLGGDLERHVGTHNEDGATDVKPKQGRTLRWVGLGSPRDIGFLASLIQFFAASVFWISTITGLPNVIPTLDEKNTAVSVVLFWTPQVVGGCGFMVASVLLMLEEQKAWWKIAPLRLGW